MKVITESSSAKERTPVDVCVVIDVSGSMANQAALKDQKTGRLEETGITRLDIVKHAAKTIAKVLGMPALT